MGVTYKFKQEVVDFILQQKKITPSASCRRLTTIVQEHFHMDVSKSAVNTVLKANRLSSPVGRHPKNKVSKNFFIPQEKKNELRAQLSMLLSTVIDNPVIEQPQSILSFSQPSVKDTEVVGNNQGSDVESHPMQDVCNDLTLGMENVLVSDSASNVSSSIMSDSQSSEVSVEGGGNSTPNSIESGSIGVASDFSKEENRKPHLFLPDPLLSQSSSVTSEKEVLSILKSHKVNVHTVWEDEAVVESGQAIAVFLVASLWEMDNKRILSNTLVKILRDQGRNISLDLMEGAIVLKAFEKDIPVDIKTSVASSIAEMIGFDLSELEDTCKDVTRLLSTDMHATLFYESTWATLSTEVACFELVTLGGQKIYVDPLWTQFSTKPILQPGYSIFLANTIERLASEFINNLEPLYISINNKKNIFNSKGFEFLPLIIGLEDDYVDSISILSTHGDYLANFMHLPKIRRGFLIAGSLLERDLNRIDFDNIGDVRNIYSPLDGRIIAYHQGKVPFVRNMIAQALVFRDDGNENKRVIFTNLNEAEAYFRDIFIKDLIFVKNKNILLYNQKFDKIIKNNCLYIKIKNNNINSAEELQFLITILNRKYIVNQYGQKLQIICKSEVS